MSKLPTVSRRSANLVLQHIASQLKPGETLPTEHKMAELGLCSRTAVRSMLVYFESCGLIGSLKERRLLRKPAARDFFDESALQSGPDHLRQVLMELIYQGDMPPGSEFSEAELARLAGMSTGSVREFLIGFAPYGLIEKKPRGGWRLCAFDRAYATELANARRLFEVAAVSHVAALPPEHPAFEKIAELIARHEALGKSMQVNHMDFPALDREFHSFLLGLLENRFALALNDTVSLVFHYHYQWDKQDEMPRNQHAVREHLAILRALRKRDQAAALAAMGKHLDSSRRTMLKSIAVREKALRPA